MDHYKQKKNRVLAQDPAFTPMAEGRQTDEGVTSS